MCVLFWWYRCFTSRQRSAISCQLQQLTVERLEARLPLLLHRDRDELRDMTGLSSRVASVSRQLRAGIDELQIG
jgi:hypothetical protein